MSTMFKEDSYKFLFPDGDDKLFPSCHASSCLLLDDGSILVACFAGSYEGAEDVAIILTRLDCNLNITERINVSVHENIPHWNPVLFKNNLKNNSENNSEIYLFYKIGKTIPNWKTIYTVSNDNGKTWSNHTEIGDHGPVKNKMIKLSNDYWLAPTSTEGDEWNSFADLSVDNGKTWTRRSIFVDRQIQPSNSTPKADAINPAKGIIQPTVWESSNGNVHMLLRSTWGKIYRSDSQDYAFNWSNAYPTKLPNNNSGIDVVKISSNGTLALVYNPIGENFGARTPLVLTLSFDNGFTWNNDYILESDVGEYSYPAIISKDDFLYITYTWNRKNIVLRKIKFTEYV